VGGGAMNLEEALRRIPTYSQELGLDLHEPQDRFKWLLASILFAKRISSEIAKRTFRRFMEEGLDTPEGILEAGWDRLVEVLDSGGYVRYDFSTASNLLEAMGRLLRAYGGLEALYEGAEGPRDLEGRLRSLKGFGPVGVNIFLRELRDIWPKADPEPSDIALEMAEKLGLRDPKPHESALVRIYLEFCKRRRCDECPVGDWCGERG